MKQCPICQSEIDANFGMAQCAKCQSVLFIDFEGNIAIGGTEDLFENHDLGDAEQLPTDIELASSDYLEVAPTENEVSNFDLEMGMQNDFESIEAHQQIVQNEDLEDVSISNSDYQYENHLGGSTLVFESEKKIESSDHCFYQLTVSGIDSSKLRKEVLDSMGNEERRYGSF